ncbi:MAG TPA: ABC transporter ATP-binding protein [Candidatus Paceibacterota bacterium]
MNPQKSIFSLLGQYKKVVFLLVLFALISNALTLVIPQLISKIIDRFGAGTLVLTPILVQFTLIAIAVAVFTYFQGVVQVRASELVAKDMRENIVSTLSKQTFSIIQALTPSRLLTTITSDTDAVKVFISQAIPTLLSSVVLILGASILLFTINWKLALVVLAIIPIIGIAFAAVFNKIKPLFTKSQAVIDKLNKVINENIIGAALIRVLNAGTVEEKKFFSANSDARDTGLKILAHFSVLIPLITLVASLATLAVILLGGHYVILDSMTIGEFTAFNTYIGILIFPIIMIGFVGTMIAQSSASFARIVEVTDTPLVPHTGTDTTPLTGALEVAGVSMVYGEQEVLKNISFNIRPGEKVAIIGPTAAGKTQLLYLLTALTTQTGGTIRYDGKDISQIDLPTLHNHIGFVFQDSVLFNTTLKENIAFNAERTEKGDVAFERAVQTAELADFIESLAKGLDTIVSERGTTLSGGQKQRIMLARALAINPSVLLLDDFTARVDTQTEARILLNVAKNYPDLTLISVTQKIGSIEHYDKIILLMEGELLATGTHSQLMATSPEYVQIYNSQRSTNEYELHT